MWVSRNLPDRTRLLTVRFNSSTMKDSSNEPEVDLEGLPPSAKLVVKVLEHEGELHQSEISERARLNESTARHALRELVEKGVLVAEIDSSDGRRLVYSLDHDS